MAICSEADAFVAASLTQFSLTARLAFMVVGPMVDVKLIALQAGTFGGRFAVRFAPLTFVVAVRSSSRRRAGGCCERGRRNDQPCSSARCCSGSTVTDTYQRYVRAGMGIWLPIAGIAIIALGLVDAGAARCARHAGGSTVTTRRTTTAIGVGWLLLAPIAALLLVAPPTLGSYGVDRRRNGRRSSPAAPVFEPHAARRARRSR